MGGQIVGKASDPTIPPSRSSLISRQVAQDYLRYIETCHCFGQLSNPHRIRLMIITKATIG